MANKFQTSWNEYNYIRTHPMGTIRRAKAAAEKASDNITLLCAVIRDMELVMGFGWDEASGIDELQTVVDGVVKYWKEEAACLEVVRVCIPPALVLSIHVTSLMLTSYSFT